MTAITRRVDECVLIGGDVVVCITDIDAGGVRLSVKGRMLGGPDDGASMEANHDLHAGQEFGIGTMVRVALVRQLADRVELNIWTPPNLDVRPQEAERGTGGNAGRQDG